MQKSQNMLGGKGIEMALHYSQYDKVMTRNDASSLLSGYSSGDVSGISVAEKLGQDYENRNFLQGYRSIFGQNCFRLFCLD